MSDKPNDRMSVEDVKRAVEVLARNNGWAAGGDYQVLMHPHNLRELKLRAAIHAWAARCHRLEAEIAAGVGLEHERRRSLLLFLKFRQRVGDFKELMRHVETTCPIEEEPDE